MAFTALIPSSSRRDIIIITTIICLLTVIISFRSIFADHVPWRPGVGDLPTFGSKHDAPASTAVTTPQDVKHQETSSTITVPATTSSSPLPKSTDICDSWPESKDIFVVMKTGATEAYDKLPIHFLTTLRCAKSYILFSDMEMEMAGHKLINTLEEIPDEVKEGNPDFDLYRTLQEYHRLREDPRPLQANNNGWNLDKYKFLHMLLNSYRERPDAPWYVFIEADTALIWDNLRTFLDKKDPSKPHYFGSPTYLNIKFAHGGSGYIISQAAMQAAVGDHPEIADKYDKDVHDVCCGDYYPGRVLLDVGIDLTETWPMINGEKPSTLPFAKNHWCQPVLTMHHLTAQEVSQVWNFEQLRKVEGITKPLMFVDIFRRFVRPILQSTREDWSNLSDDFTYFPPNHDSPDEPSYNGRKWSDLNDIERNSTLSAENCQTACNAEKECMQWRYLDSLCSLGKTIKLGASKKMDNGKRSTSGWMMERVGRFEVEAGNCTMPDWTV